MTLGPIPGSASSEPISQSIRGVWVFTFASCPAVGSALASGAKVNAAMPSPASAIFLMRSAARAPEGPHDPVVDEALDARPTPVPYVFPYAWCDCTPAPAHNAQPNQVKTSLRGTVWRLRLRMISSSWPKQWVMVGRLAWPTTICWG